MGKKKKGKAQKYAKVSDENNTKTSAKKEQQNGKPRRSKRRKRPVENSESLDDYKFRQEIEDGSSRTIVNIEADGNCLFGSLSDQLYYDFGSMHTEVRHEVCDFIDAKKEDFQYFLLEDGDDGEDVADFDSYVHNMRQDGEWGGNVELVAAARLYRNAIMIEHGQSENGGPDMMISYHGEEHYNSVRDENAGMPPPPSRTSFEKRTAVIETNVSETEATSETDEMDIDEEPTTDAHYPLQNIREPTEHDVLFGRGAGVNLHPGNKRFRNMVEARKVDYAKLGKTLDKQHMAQEIIRQWRNQDPPGRFLKFDEQSGFWQEVDDKRAQDKTMQALRQKPPNSSKQQGDEENGSGSNEETMASAATKQQVGAPPASKPPKRNSPCSCGSGLRYKKCCLEANKSKERARKWKAKHGSSTVSNDDSAMTDASNDDENEEKMDGNFRVLKI